jgi:hypothetical protein
MDRAVASHDRRSRVPSRRDDQLGAVVIVEVEDGDADRAELSLSHLLQQELVQVTEQIPWCILRVAT